MRMYCEDVLIGWVDRRYCETVWCVLTRLISFNFLLRGCIDANG